LLAKFNLYRYTEGDDTGDDEYDSYDEYELQQAESSPFPLPPQASSLLAELTLPADDLDEEEEEEEEAGDGGEGSAEGSGVGEGAGEGPPSSPSSPSLGRLWDSWAAADSTNPLQFSTLAGRERWATATEEEQRDLASSMGRRNAAESTAAVG
jgi:hypothetical protein